MVVPDRSSGRARAARFVHNGGGWTAHGRTLPPALDIEYNPYDDERGRCGPSKAEMVSWITSLGDEIERLTCRRPVICTTTHRPVTCTTTHGWNTRTGGSGVFAAGHALWIARHDAAGPGALPAGRSSWTFRQRQRRRGPAG
ncbi:GH25 family lysozyme [Streptomyces massasporeus]|uniref:GH25 family lysozyme n=1 Tax=Streptomyces massasporeus TaxID=67324 RepID=UPI0036D03097